MMRIYLIIKRDGTGLLACYEDRSIVDNLLPPLAGNVAELYEIGLAHPRVPPGILTVLASLDYFNPMALDNIRETENLMGPRENHNNGS